MASRDALRPLHELQKYPHASDNTTLNMLVERREAARERIIQEWTRKTLNVSIPALPSPSTPTVAAWPLACGNFTANQITITESTPSAILSFIAKGLWSAEEVLLAFIGRTLIAHHLTNPLADVRFDEALLKARYLDGFLAENGHTVGPLHGLPMTIKDAFDIKELPTTFGLVAKEDNITTTSDDLVAKLRSIGAVFFAKTNVPQSLLSGECANVLFGRTASPHNINLSAGGSSGGEGSLIALGGSPLGIGTDSAGSIRTPANFNGIFGLCPSHGRLPRRSPQISESVFAINGVAGPMSRSIDGLEVYTKALLSLKPWEWDSSVVAMPWDQAKYDSVRDSPKLCFGFIAHDGVVRPHPPIQRGLDEMKAAVLRAGHETVDLDFFFDADDQLWERLLKVFTYDGCKSLSEMVARYDEPLLAETMQPDQCYTSTLPEWLANSRSILRLQQKYLDKLRTQGISHRPDDQ